MSDRSKMARIADRCMPIPECGCLIWMGPLNDGGYGPHREAYEAEHGPIPAGLVLDHKCRVRSCCNSGHLEPVTTQVNVLRGVSFSAKNAVKTHCPQGHPLSGDVRNSFGARICMECMRIARRKWRKKIRQQQRERSRARRLCA